MIRDVTTIARPLTSVEDHTVSPASLPVVMTVILWILGLSAWGILVNLTSGVVELAIFGVSIIPATVLFWKKPEYGIVGLMFFASGFLEPDFIDIRLPIGGGLEMRDIMLILMFGILLFRGLYRGKIAIPWGIAGGSLAVFLLMVVFSLFNALVFEGVPGNWALSDARILLFYAVFFITAWGVTDKPALVVVLVGSFVVADITAAIVLIQQYLGPANFLLDSMSDGSWQVWETVGATRVVPPGIIYMYFMMLISLGLMVFWRGDWRRTLFLVFHTAFLSLSLLFTFTRAAWIASAIALLIILVMLFPLYKRHLARIFVIGAAVVMLIVGVIGVSRPAGPTIQSASLLGIIDRFSTIFAVEDTLDSGSLQWRFFEHQEASKAIRESPLVGVGLGNTYRNLTVFQGEARGLWTDGDLSYKSIDRFTRYVHSSYFAITVKMGIPALIVFLVFCGSAILKSISLHYRLPTDIGKGLTLTVGAGMIGLLQWSLAHAHLMLVASTAVIGLVIGLLVSVQSIYLDETQAETLQQ